MGSSYLLFSKVFLAAGLPSGKEGWVEWGSPPFFACVRSTHFFASRNPLLRHVAAISWVWVASPPTSSKGFYEDCLEFDSDFQKNILRPFSQKWEGTIRGKWTVVFGSAIVFGPNESRKGQLSNWRFFPLLICRVCTGKGGMGNKLAITAWFAALSW